MNTHAPTSRRGGAGRGFTVTELLVVIALIVILILIAVPSFQAMIRSSDTALAETQLRAALRVARDAALRSNGRGDGAAVFFYDRGGRVTVVPCQKVGELLDDKTGGGLVTREVFAPAPGLQPLSLPKGWSVRAFVPGALLSQDWYGRSPAYTSGASSPRPYWMFPETDFYNSEATDDGEGRSTFMVRFQSGTGVQTSSPNAPALVIAPRPSGAGRTGAPFDTHRADRAQDLDKFVRGVLNDPSLTLAQRRMLIGRKSGDMVLARPVQALALYEERELAAAFGLRPDGDTGTVYKGPTDNGSGSPVMSGYQPEYPAGATSLTDDNIAWWIVGDVDFDGSVRGADGGGGGSPRDNTLSRLYGVDRYSGDLRRLETQP